LKPWGLALPHLNGLKKEPQGSFFHLYIQYGGLLMDIYHDSKLIANSTTIGQAGDKKVKGILVSNTSSAATATLHLYGITGATYSATIGVAATQTQILPIKIAGASTAASTMTIHALY
jgi:hypothetical protein